MSRAATPTLTWPMHANPRIHNAGNFPLSDPAFRFSYKSHTHALHLHEYDGVIDMDGKQYPLTPGSITISPAGGITRYALPRPGRHWCIHFHVGKNKQPTINLPLVPSVSHNHLDMAGRLAHIAHLYAAPSDDCIAHAAASLALQELLLLLARGQSDNITGSSTSQADHAVDRLLQLIHQNLDKPLRIAELADEVQLSQNYLARRFRQRMSQTIPGYILQARIDRARLLLSTTNFPVKQIAAQVGMPDPQHFNKQFRHLTGHCPTQMRKES